jgi:hypothetical protein
MHTINPTSSSFGANVKELMLYTPCYIMKKMELDSWSWTQDNFIVHYPKLEQVTIGIHGIHSSSSSPNIEWARAMRLALVMDIGIADMVAHIWLPMLERVLLIYPEWLMEETSYDNE